MIGAMAFNANIGALYRQHGPNHILPFIGGSYEQRDRKASRVVVVSINAYASDAELRREGVVAGSKLFSGLAYDTRPETKSGLYATNAIKVFTSEAFKRSNAISTEMIWGCAPT